MTGIARNILLTGRVEYVDNRLVNIRDFGGALGNSQNATAAMLTAREFARQWGRGLYIPKGVYQIAETVDLQDNGTEDFTQARIVGENVNGDAAWVYSHTNQSCLEWIGLPTDPMIRVSRSALVEGLMLRVAGGFSATCGVEWDKHPAGLAGTAVIIRDCGFWGALGDMTDGIRIGTQGNVFNLEHGQIINCRFNDVQEYGLHVMSTTGQAKYELVERCQFVGGLASVALIAGSVVLRGCGFHDATEAAILFRTDVPGSGIPDTFGCYDFDSERCHRFLRFAAGITGTPYTAIIQNGRFAITDDVAPDGEWIGFGSTGPLTIIGTHWEVAGSYNPEDIHLAMANSNAVARGRLTSIGNVYQNSTPWRNWGSDEGPLVTTLSDRWRGVGATANIASQLDLAIA